MKEQNIFCHTSTVTVQFVPFTLSACFSGLRRGICFNFYWAGLQLGKLM